MIFGQTNQQLSAWKTEMKIYEKNKRTKKPFGKSLPIVQRITNSDIKIKQTLFNPVLQTYKHQSDQNKRKQKDQINRVKSLMNHFKNITKYDKGYDIVNLNGVQPGYSQTANKKLGPVRNIYNVINNQKLPEFYYQNRQMRLPIQREKVLLGNDKRQFDIVACAYKDNHQEKFQRQIKQKDNKILQKYWKTHDYDSVFGKYYDPNKQQEYQQQLKQKMNQHGKDFEKRFPPSYIQRQTFISDFTKPIPENLKTLDQRNLSKKKRYQLKYIIQDQYEKRNQDYDQRKAQIIKNRVHDGRILDEKSKQFDIINNKDYKPTRAQELYGKKPILSTWDKLHETSKIKSSGFAVQ